MHPDLLSVEEDFVVGDAKAVAAVEILDDAAERSFACGQRFAGIVAAAVGADDELPAGRIEKRAVGRDGVAGFGVEVAPCRRLLGQTHPVEAHVAADVAGATSSKPSVSGCRRVAAGVTAR